VVRAHDEIGVYASPAPLAPARKLALVAEVLAVHARAGWVLRRHDIRTAVALLRGDTTGTGGPDAYVAGVRLAKVAARVLDPSPLDSRCLRLSLVVCAMLARRGIGSSVVIGVKGVSSFGAHAWVEVGGRPVVPASEGEFERLVEL
jgi:hypothetical protein